MANIPNGVANRIPEIVPSVSIELDRVRHIRFDMPAIFDAETLYSERRKDGKNYSFYDILVEGTALGIACLLWAGLRHEDPALTLDQVASMFRPKDINRISLAVNKAALDQVEPAEEDKAKGETQKKTESNPDKPDGEAGGPSAGSSSD